MENASKALLIAAAILIVIILVAFGVKVLNSTSGSKDLATTTGQAISDAIPNNIFTNNFSNEIKKYAGKNIPKDEVIKLLNIVKSNNEKNTRKIAVQKIVAGNYYYDETDETYKKNVNNMKKVENHTKISYLEDLSSSIEVNAKAKPDMFGSLHIYVYYHSDGEIGVIGFATGNLKYISDYNSQIVGE